MGLTAFPYGHTVIAGRLRVRRQWSFNYMATCDSTDTLPGLVQLPHDIRAGDYLEFGTIGAYSISGRTDYNGYYSDRIVTITSPTESPPSV